MLFRSIVTAIFAVAFSSTAVSALPSGAPKCAISSAVIAAGHKKPDDPTLGYSVSIAASGASWEITVTNSAGRKSFQGTLFYITTSLDPSKHLAQPPAPTQPPPTTAPTTAPGGGGGGGVYGDQKPATTRKVIKCTPKKYSKTYSKPPTETVAPSIPGPEPGTGTGPVPGPGATPEPSSPVVLPTSGGGYGKPEPKAKGGYGKPDSKAKGGYGGAPAPATKGGSY
ncbi:hypothetical protein BASA61_005793 [Batrachochytrium salamandrivorans]|nr:hypothetical protein BASA61_005793 [Batrachochytrium salamandrivorans]